MKITVKTEVRNYSIDIGNEGTYHAFVDELINPTGSEKIIADLLSEKARYERSIAQDIENAKRSTSPKNIDMWINLERKERGNLVKLTVEHEAYLKEFNLTIGDKYGLESIIETGKSMNLIDSKSEKITTRPVTYVKIE